MKTNLSFIRCITGSKSGCPGCQPSTSFSPSLRINLQSPACPLPGPCWKGKAGIQNHITSSSPSPRAPHSCPPLATSLLSSVRARTTAGVKDPLLTEKGKQGMDSNLKEIKSGGKKNLTRAHMTRAWRTEENHSHLNAAIYSVATQHREFPLKPRHFNSC